MTHTDFTAGFRKSEPQIAVLILIRCHEVNRLHNRQELFCIAHKVEACASTCNGVPHDKCIRGLFANKFYNALKHAGLFDKTDLDILEGMLLEQRLELRLDAVANDPARRNEFVFVLLRERGADRLAIHTKMRHRLDVRDKARSGRTVEASHCQSVNQFFTHITHSLFCRTLCDVALLCSASRSARSWASKLARDARLRRCLNFAHGCIRLRS